MSEYCVVHDTKDSPRVKAALEQDHEVVEDEKEIKEALSDQSVVQDMVLGPRPGTLLKKVEPKAKKAVLEVKKPWVSSVRK